MLIRGPSGSGKSRLAFDLILAGRAGQIATATLVGDDRVLLEAVQRQLMVRPVPELAGLIEIRGLGIRACDFAKQACVGLVVDLSAEDADRLPAPESQVVDITGIQIPRISVGIGFSALPLVLAAFSTRPSDDCRKGIGNHISPTIATQ